MKTIPILYQNDEIYIINKPAGLAVQGGVKIAHPLDAVLSEQTGSKVYLVHRLDQDTAGLMVVAKSPQAAAKWTHLIAEKTVCKEYEALCIGTLPQQQGVIRTAVVARGDEKPAVTHYTVESVRTIVCADGPLAVSRVRLVLETGRMHQIRIHLAQNGCPIAGDDQHGNFRRNKQLRSLFGVRMLMLAAVRLTVPAEQPVFEIALPDHMERFWESCADGKTKSIDIK